MNVNTSACPGRSFEYHQIFGDELREVVCCIARDHAVTGARVRTAHDARPRSRTGLIAAKSTSIQDELECFQRRQQRARKLDVVVTWVHMCAQPKVVVAMPDIIQVEANERNRLSARKVDLEVVGNQVKRTAVSLADLEGEVYDTTIIAHELVGRPPLRKVPVRRRGARCFRRSNSPGLAPCSRVAQRRLPRVQEL